MARLDLATVGRLTFTAPDPVRYPALRLAREVMATGGLAGAGFNAARAALRGAAWWSRPVSRAATRAQLWLQRRDPAF